MSSHAVRTYLRTPKAMLIAALLALIAVAYPVDGQAVLLRTGLAALAAVVVDLLFMEITGRMELPDSALLTGLIAGMVLGPTVPLGVPILAAAFAITTKRLLRGKRGHILNPAAAGLLIVGLLLSSEQSWWGGLGDDPAILIVAVAATGLWIASRVNKLPTMLMFLGVYFLLLTAGSLLGSPLSFADAFREPETGAAMYFAAFMLTDPPTSPTRVGDQIWFAVVAAVIAVACLATNIGGVYYLLIGLLVANALEGARRAMAARRQLPARVAARAQGLSPL